MKENKWHLNLSKSQKFKNVMKDCGYKILKIDKLELKVNMNTIQKYLN